MKQGFSLDLTAPAADGFVWDCSQKPCRERARELIRITNPFIIIGSPECRAFSTLQYINARTPEGREKLRIKVQQARKHLYFCAQIYRMQMASGRYFLHEHPKMATS